MNSFVRRSELNIKVYTYVVTPTLWFKNVRSNFFPSNPLNPRNKISRQRVSARQFISEELTKNKNHLDKYF